jgi:hypothetical protein
MKPTPFALLLALAAAGCVSVTSESEAPPTPPAEEAAPAEEAKPAKAVSNQRVMPEVRYYEIADT